MMKTELLTRLRAKNSKRPYGAFIMLLFFALFLNAQNMYSQDKTITGTVKDEAGLPLPGASVIIKGTNIGTQTNFDGYYSLSVSNDATTLVVSFLGFTSQEVAIAGQSSIDVQLVVDASELDEVVIVGYGTQKKTSLTAAVSTIKAEELQNTSVANASNALVGRMAGIITRQTSGAVGQDQTKINIRGISTIGNSNPLIIIDGVIRNSLNEIDPSNVESYTVLKDAAAVAPYGMSGANGVILVTTKSGSIGPAKFQVNSSIGFQNPTILQDYANSYEYARAFNEAENNVGVPTADRRYSADDLANFQKSIEGDPSIDQNLYPNQDVWDFVQRDNAPISKTNISASGGSDFVKYYTGVNYLHQGGNWSKSKLDRIGLVAKLDLTPTDKTTIGLSINSYNQQIKGPTAQGSQPYTDATALLPTEPVVWSDGRLALGARDRIIHDVINNGERLEDKTQILTKLSIEHEIIEGLKIKGAFSYDWTTSFNKHWQEPRSTYYTINHSSTPYSFNEVPSTEKHSLSQTQRVWKNYTYQGIITYNKTIDKHGISLLGVAEARKTSANNFSAGRSGFEIPIDELSLGSADKDFQSNSGGSSETSQVGYVYKLTYDYNNKYLFETAGRYDGHYYFAPGKKYGFFPSVSLGWNISQEPFMSGIEFVDRLKLRTSLGQSGNLAGGPNQYSSSLVLYGNSFPFGNSPTQGLYASREGNLDITWEKATKFNFGFDFSVLKGLISGEVDYFSEKRNNMLLSPNSNVPQEYGIGLGQVNAGKMNNKGIDILLKGNKQFANGIRAGLTLTYTYAHNTLIETFENPVTAEDPIRSRVGKEYRALFGLIADGLFQESDDINNDGIINADDGFPEQLLGGTIRPGNIKYIDVNQDGVIDVTDESRIGYPDTPEIIYSILPSFSWKGFDMNLMFQGAAHSSMNLEGTYISAFAETRNYPNYLLGDSWTPETPGARFPALSPTGVNANDAYPFSTFYKINASYLRLKNLEVGYSLPTNLIESMGFRSVRFYVSGVNLYTWSDAKEFGIDAEASRVAQRGWYHPQQRSWSLGLNLGF